MSSSYTDPHLLCASTINTTTNATKTGSNSKENDAPPSKKLRGGQENEDGVDEATRFRQEIRAVKGALLSARSFPAGSKVTALPVGGRVG
jgi:hypothetical protein